MTWTLSMPRRTAQKKERNMMTTEENITEGNEKADELAKRRSASRWRCNGGGSNSCGKKILLLLNIRCAFTSKWRNGKTGMKLSSGK